MFYQQKIVQRETFLQEQKRLENDQKGFYLPRFLHGFSPVENRGMPVVFAGKSMLAGQSPTGYYARLLLIALSYPQCEYSVYCASPLLAAPRRSPSLLAASHCFRIPSFPATPCYSLPQSTPCYSLPPCHRRRSRTAILVCSFPHPRAPHTRCRRAPLVFAVLLSFTPLCISVLSASLVHFPLY